MTHPADARAALTRLFREAPTRAAWFAPAFLARMPAEEVATVIGALQNRHGAFEDVAETETGYVVRLASAEVPTQLVLDARGLIAGVFFHPPVPTTRTLDDHLRAVAALPGRTAVLVSSDGRVRASHAAELPLAVGSAFKLAVLRATADACAAGRLAWDGVVRLDPAWRSLPTGILQDWPERSPLTMETLANLMISISDNTATDALIHLVGRDAVERLSPRNAPFLTTREAFIVKQAGNAAMRRDWAGANPEGRRAILARLTDNAVPRVDRLATEVTSEIDWFFSAEELHGLLDATHHLPAFRISRGPAGVRPWRSVAYKGGSEAGVLNLSALVVTKSGRRHCVIVTWNYAAGLQEERLIEPFRGLLRCLDE